MPGRGEEARRAEALDRYWDALTTGAIPPEGGPLDPARGASLRRLHDLGEALSPDPADLRTLKEDLMRTHAATYPPTALGAPPSTTANGRSPSWARPHPTPLARPSVRRRGWLRPWGRAIDLAAVAALVLMVVGGTMIGNGGLPLLGGFWQGDEARGGDGDVPMLGGNPARTGEQPGPGPEAMPGPRWRVFAGVGATSPIVVDDVVYLAGDTGSVAAYDGATGAERWRTGLAANASDPTVVDGTVYLGVVRNSEMRDASAGSVEAYDAATGAQRWSSSTGRFGGSSPVVQDGVVYGMGDAEVFAFDAETGDERWRRVLPTGVCGCVGSGVAVAGGEVFVPGGDTLYALDAESGQERWRFRTEGDWLAMPVVADGRVYVGAGVDLGDTWLGKVGAVHALDTATGDRVWTAVAVYVADAPAVADGTVYVPTVGFSRSDEPTTPEADADAYRELRDGLVALDAETGDHRWSVDLPQAGSQPAVVDGTVYLSAKSYRDGSVAAFDAASGEERWRLDLRGSVVASPAVVGGRLYVTNYHNGALFALDEASATGTPGAGGALLLGEPCESGPRGVVDAAPDGTPAGGFDADLIETWPVTEDLLPTGPAAPASAVAGIAATVAGLARCGDAAPAIQATYYSDDFFRRQVAAMGGDAPIGAAVSSGWQASPFMPVVVRDARDLPDGRIGAVVEGSGPPAFMAFVPSDGGWLVDEVVLLALDPAARATPVS